MNVGVIITQKVPKCQVYVPTAHFIYIITQIVNINLRQAVIDA